MKSLKNALVTLILIVVILIGASRIFGFDLPISTSSSGTLPTTSSVDPSTSSVTPSTSTPTPSTSTITPSTSSSSSSSSVTSREIKAGTYEWADELTDEEVSGELFFTSNGQSFNALGNWLQKDNESNEINHSFGYGQSTSQLRGFYFNTWEGNPEYKTIEISNNQQISIELYNFMFEQGNLTKIESEDLQTTETWLLNEQIDAMVKVYFEANFTSNNQLFTELSMSMGSLDYKNTETDTSENVFNIESWTDEAYRTIVFDEATTGELLSWLQANGVKQ